MTKSSGSSSRRNQAKRVLRAAIMSTPAVIAALSITHTAQAADLYWDINGTAADANGATTGAAGTWNTAGLANWSTSSAGTAVTQTWAGAGDTAVFAAGTGQTGTYTVTNSGTNVADGLRFEDGVVTISGGTLDLALGNINLARNATSAQTISSVVTGTTGLSLTRAGTAGTVQLALSGNNNYSGATTITAGANGAVLQLTLSNNNALGAIGSGNGTAFASTGSEAAFIALGGNRIINEEITVTGGGTSGVTPGQLRATGGVNTWAGNIIVNGTVNNLGTGLAGIGASAGTLVLTGVISNVGTGANTAGVVWAKTGAGTLVLRSANTNVGFNRVFDGITVVETDGVFGTASIDGAFDGQTIMTSQSLSTPTIAFNHASGFSYSTNETITTSGLPVASGGTGLGNGTNAMIDNFGGTNTFAGKLRIGGPTATGPTRILASVGARTGTSLELSGAFYSSNSGAGTAAPATPTDPREIHKVGGGTVIISGTNDTVDGVTSGDSDQYRLHGTFIIDAGSLVLRNNTAGGTGSMAGNTIGPMNFQVNLGGSLVLDNQLGVNTARIAPTAALTLSAGEVKLIGNDTTSVDQPGGSLSVASYSTITIQQPASTTGATTTFSLGTLSRSNRGTALLRGINNTTGFAGLSGTLKGGGGGANSTTISILTEVVGDVSSTGDGSDFVTSVGGAARVLSDANGEYLTLASGNAALDNTKVTANTSITADTTVNSIKLTGGVTPTTVAISPGMKLFVSSGGILGVGAANSSAAITGGQLTFEQSHIETDIFTGVTSLITDSSNEGIITVPSGASLTISSDIAGDQGVTKSGQGTLTLTGTGSTYGQGTGGQTTINAGVLAFNTDANLGNSTAPIYINGGTLRPLATSSSTRNIVLASPGTNTIDAGASANFSVSGLVSGNRLTKIGDGVLELTNSGNTFNGVDINAGYLAVSNSGALGAGTIVVNGNTTLGGALRASASFSMSKNLSLQTTSTTKSLDVVTGVTMTWGTGSASTNVISGAGNLIKTGGGTLVLGDHNAQHSYTGDTWVKAGVLNYVQQASIVSPATAVVRTNGLPANPASQRYSYWTMDGGTIKYSLSSTGGADYSSGNRGITITANNGTFEIDSGQTVDNFAGLTGPGTLIKTGTGTFGLRCSSTTVNDATGNPFSGKFDIQAGSLRFGRGNLLGTNTAADAIKLAGGTTLSAIANSGTGGNGVSAFTVVQGITLSGSGTPLISTASGVAVRYNAPISGVSNTALTHTISGTGSTVVAAVGTYQGATNLVGGGAASTLRIGVNNALPTGTTLNLNALSATGAAIFDLAEASGGSAFNQTVAAVANTGGAGTQGTVTNTGTGQGTFTVNNSTTNTFSGKFTGTNTNVGHTGAGNLVLTGAGNNFGTLSGTSTTTIGNGVNALSVTATAYRDSTLAVDNLSTAVARAQANPYVVASEAGTSKVTALTLGTDSKLDLTNTKIITQDPSMVATPVYDGDNDIYIYDGVHGLVQSAKNPLNGGSWDGTRGITTTQTDATTGTLTTLAVGSGAELRFLGPTDTELFAGQTINGDSTVVMYTWGGDANMDGKLDGEDYFRIDSNSPLSGFVFGFANGDFNYDGKINGEDYTILDGNITFQQASGNEFWVRPPEFGDSGGGSAAGLTAVPEPASIGIVAMGALSVLGRRRRKM